MQRKVSSKTASALAIVPVCLAVWAAAGLAQNNTQRTAPTGRQRQVISLVDSNCQTESERAVIQLQKDVGGRSRQVVDLLQRPLANRMVVRLDDPSELRLSSSVGDTSISSTALPPIPTSSIPEIAASRSTAEQREFTLGIPKAGSDEWVDQAIPSELFDSVNQHSRRVDAESTGIVTPDNAAQRAVVGAQPNPGQHNSTMNDSATHDSRVGEGAGTQHASQQRTSPEQAIPDWILQQGGYPVGPANRPAEAPTILDSKPLSSDGVPSHPIHPLQGSKGTNESAAEESAEGSLQPSDSHWPVLALGEYFPSHIDAVAQKTDYCESDFSPQGGPQGSTFDPTAASYVYRGKFPVPVQRPLIELWRPLYTSGIYPQALTWFGATNPMKPHFMVYGDMRTAFGANRNTAGKSNIWGNVVNLDMDLQLTSTERVHAFVAPLNRGTQATGLSFEDDVDFIDGTNFDFVTLFFEGDLGALVGGATNRFPPYDLPFTFGLIPLVYQNGIWANDAVLGAAVALPARHSRRLKWSNFDASLFWATDKITTDAFPGQDSAADFFGSAWFIDAYEGYIEADYAFVNDNTGAGRGYHNMALAFTRRYFARVSNSVRFILNTGQENLDRADRTADGHLLLIENSFISAYPNTVVPYVNLFYGQGRPQSLARVGQAGGVLNNTGINFETDGITNYPTLDPTGHNTFGLAAGINLLGSQFAHQLILETAFLKATGPASLRNAEGDQYGVGMRYQKPLSHNLIFRTDHMLGFREAASDLSGSRFEFRWKF